MTIGLTITAFFLFKTVNAPLISTYPKSPPFSCRVGIKELIGSFFIFDISFYLLLRCCTSQPASESVLWIFCHTHTVPVQTSFSVRHWLDGRYGLFCYNCGFGCLEKPEF